MFVGKAFYECFLSIWMISHAELDFTYYKVRADHALTGRKTH